MLTLSIVPSDPALVEMIGALNAVGSGIVVADVPVPSSPAGYWR